MPNYVSSGSEFIVNTATGSHQNQARIAHFSNGNYVVIWKSVDDATNDSGTLRAQLFDQYGNRLGGEFTVESHGGGMQLNPNIAVLADDSFVVTWQTEDSGFYGATSTIAAQRFSATGTAIGSEFAVNSAASSFPTAPAITALSNGSYVVSWDDFLNHAVRAQVFAANGTRIGNELVVGTYPGLSATSLTVQALANGGFVAAWNALDGSGQGVRAQLFTSTGTEAGGEFWANSQTADNQSGATVVTLANGNFVVLWTSYNAAQDGSASAIKAQIFTAGGVAVGSEFLVNQIGTGYQLTPRATALADGGFMVAWQSAAGAANAYDNTLRARVFDAGGTATGGEFQVDALNASQSSYLGGITVLPNGDILVAYDTWGGDGDGDGVLVHTLVPQSATQTAPTIVSNGGGASAIVAVNEYTSLVTNVRAVDPDGPQATTFAITGGADAGQFHIDSATGRLTFNYPAEFANPGDADGDNVYDVVVTASDGTLTDTQTLHVAVQDVAEGITITSPTDVFTPENDNLVYGGITATSASGLPVYYQIIGGADAGLVEITPDGYFIFAPGFAPDFETPGDADGDNVFEVTVIMGDGFATATVDVRIHVTDVPELDFTSPSQLTIAENDNYVVAVAVAGDGQNQVGYSIVGGDDAPLFWINAYTGDLYFLSAPDFEFAADSNSDNVYQVAVEAVDSLGNHAIQLISVTIANQPEVLITSSMYQNTIENQTAVMQVGAYSPDGIELTYFIEGGADAALFTIDAQTGQLSFVTDPNYELPLDADGNNTYQVIVYVGAVDHSVLAGMEFSITVNDVDDHPVFTSSNAYVVPENGTAVATLSASHPANQAPYFFLGGGADDALFTLDPFTGELSFNSAPDNEAPGDAGADNVYDLVICVSDGTTFTSQGLTVTVGNVNEAPQITSPGSISMAENANAVLTIASTDPEGTARTYSIVGGADAARFTINATTGALSFIAAPNFEAPSDAGGNNVYDVVVQASDGSLTDTQALAVTVTNVNEAPAITSGASASVAENGTAVMTVSSTDPEGTARTYSIAGGADAASFTINATTGALSFIAAPNYESPSDTGGDNVYDVVVQASDGSLTATQAVSVTVGNVNEAPVITSGGGGASASVSVAENGTAVAIVNATDPEGTARTYSIVGGADAARFAINATTGALSFLAAPNHEAPSDIGANNVYDVVVQASDGSLVDTQALAVTVTNVNEAPVITSGGGGASAAYTVNENSLAVTTIGAADPDGTAMSYAIVGGADAARFTINASTGALSFASAPNYESPNDAGANNVYDVVVQASDGSLVDTQSLSITVANVVDGLTITGTSPANTLTGTTAEDTISGLGGNDTITGGFGRDVLSGGAGNDTFVYSSLADSLLSAPDMILDFGTGNDKINLSAIDANANAAGNQAFSWIGTGTFTGVAGQLRYYQSGGDTFVTGDVNGDGVGDFAIQLDPLLALSANQFIL